MTEQPEQRQPTGDLVPDSVIPAKYLPQLKYREMPEAISWKRMIGPSIVLAGLSLGSGEFILWPHIVYKAGFIFFWACILGVLTQFFLNMEIERWTLATGESAITGFCRLSKNWAWVFLLLNIIPWMWPGWATGAGSMMSWMIFGPQVTEHGGSTVIETLYVPYFGIGSLILVGLVLTAGPVVYNTVEKIQIFLVGFILVIAMVLGFLVIRPDALAAMGEGMMSIGEMPALSQNPVGSDLTLIGLLGALAFAGAGGTTNLGQSNFIKDKGYGMGKYIGRITSPMTGQDEAIADVGYLFPHTHENMARWKRWWRAANIEHFFSFFITCVVTLMLMTLISYSLFYNSSGELIPGMEKFGSGMNFVLGQATTLGEKSNGTILKFLFFSMGIAILLTTELGVLDVVSRISADIVKVNYLRNCEYWSQSRLYFLFLWMEIVFGCLILLFSNYKEPYGLLKMSAAMNGFVMLIYSLLLLYMNGKILPRIISLSPLRFIALAWAAAFFGYFSFQALKYEVIPKTRQMFEVKKITDGENIGYSTTSSNAEMLTISSLRTKTRLRLLLTPCLFDSRT